VLPHFFFVFGLLDETFAKLIQGKYHCEAKKNWKQKRIRQAGLEPATSWFLFFSHHCFMETRKRFSNIHLPLQPSAIPIKLPPVFTFQIVLNVFKTHLKKG
jgi:hypothetical protein